MMEPDHWGFVSEEDFNFYTGSFALDSLTVRVMVVRGGGWGGSYTESTSFFLHFN